MTDEELDLIASAYVDGEATPEEVALVEREPALAARVEEFRALDAEIAGAPPVPENLKEQQISAALAAFDATPKTTGQAPATVSVGAPENVIDLTDRSSGRGGSDSTPLTDRTAPTSIESRSMFPSWLAAAAAVVVIGGGVVFSLNRLSGGGDDAETATADVASDAPDAGEGEVSAEARAMEESTEEAEDTDQAAGTENFMDADDEEDDAMEEEEEAMEDEAADAAASSGPADEGGDAESTEGGFFPDEPIMTFSSVPDPDTAMEALSDLPEFRSDVFRSNCGESLGLPDDSTVGSFAPIEIAGEPAELFLIVGSDGAESPLIVDAGCEPLSP